jgi:REP element-mobilizing transposase RayT
MCIAVYKPYGTPAVSKDILHNCFDNNDDGAGYAWWDKKEKTWHVRKGFLTFDAFWKSFGKRKFGKKSKYVAHFRIGTSGIKGGPTCTHPFPVSKEPDKLEALSYKSKFITMHNGVVGAGDGNLSDTMVAVRDHTSVLWQYADDDRVESLLCELLKYGSNRWLITDEEHVCLYGDWDEDKEMGGVFFSNGGYKYSRSQWSRGYNKRHVSGKVTYEPKKDEDKCVTAYTGLTPGHFYGENGRWDWDKFAKAQIADTSDATSSTSNGMVNVNSGNLYNGLPSVVGLVDEHGNILWDEGYDSREDVPVCPHCKCNEYLIDVDDDAIPLTTVTKEEVIACLKCGAVHQHADGKVLWYDEDIRADFEKKKEAHG